VTGPPLGMVEPLGPPDRPHGSELGPDGAVRCRRRRSDVFGVADSPLGVRLGFEAAVEAADEPVEVL